MASIDNQDCVEYKSVSLSVSVESSIGPHIQAPKVHLPKDMINSICEKFSLCYDPEEEYYAPLFSIPDLVADVHCTAACTPSIWMQLIGSTVSMQGDFEFAVHRSKIIPYLDWCLVASCKNSMILL